MQGATVIPKHSYIRQRQCDRHIHKIHPTEKGADEKPRNATIKPLIRDTNAPMMIPKRPWSISVWRSVRFCDIVYLFWSWFKSLVYSFFFFSIFVCSCQRMLLMCVGRRHRPQYFLESRRDDVTSASKTFRSDVTWNIYTMSLEAFQCFLALHLLLSWACSSAGLPIAGLMPQYKPSKF